MADLWNYTKWGLRQFDSVRISAHAVNLTVAVVEVNVGQQTDYSMYVNA
jgi:hypothetical protein